MSGNYSECLQRVTVQDTTKPIAICKSVTIYLVNGIASITPSDLFNGNSSSCNPFNYSVSNSIFNCNNAGNNNVVLTVSDKFNNSSTCTSIVNVVGAVNSFTIKSIPTSIINKGGIYTNLYLGYGAQSTTLEVLLPSNGEPYTYSWTGVGLSNKFISNPIFTPTKGGTFNFTCEVTNKYGCKSTSTISICVLDVRVYDVNGNATGKIYMCHKPPGSTNNFQQLELNPSTVATHIENHEGCKFGRCGEEVCGTTANVASRIIN